MKVSRRPGLQEAASIDVPAVRAIAGRMAGQGLREAYESVLVGDMVVRHQTRHWQGHDGHCLCMTGQETVEHVFWQCPRYAQHRWGGSRCSQAASCMRPLCQRVLGTPLVLQELADWMAANPNQNVTIAGHTDSSGQAAANMALSLARAQTLRDILVTQYQIAADRISAIGAGDTQPLVDNATAAGRAQNRRVEVAVTP